MNNSDCGGSLKCKWYLLGIIILLAVPGVYAQQDAVLSQADTSSESSDFDDFPILIADSDTAYIDNAAIGSQFRWRIDAGFDNERPDRAEFFYAKCGCFGSDAPGPRGEGLTTVENSLDSYELRLDYEHAVSPKLSFFATLPIRSVDGNFIESETGLGDVEAGVKYGLIGDSMQALTFQLRGYFPTADADKGLGNDHYTIEPALLYLRKLGERASLSAELRYWRPIDGSSATPFPGDYSGDIVRYGIGLSYDIVFASGRTVTPVLELVGWSLRDGFSATSIDGRPANIDVNDEDGTDIANLKFGFRWPLAGGQSVYLGYGRALTDEKWYDDVIRLEWRLSR